VAGSAVFRTSGHATPTLTIAQLALRLADTLNRKLAG
jgi:choline dehydrogenase-like flavoprotein